LIKNVLILDELKNKTSTNKAVIELNIKKITLLEEVITVTSKAYISSNSSILDELNDTITYLGNVKAQIENE
jgi:lipopolysaccharide assembly outer membrane protein LptD (OstA)